MLSTHLARIVSPFQSLVLSCASVVLTVGLLAVFVPGAWAGDGGFAAAETLPVPVPQSLAVGDFNRRDGRPDLAVVGGDHLVHVFLRSPAGGFTAAPTVTAGAGARRIAVLDVNADGNDDLVVTNDSDMSVFAGVGDGTFTRVQFIPLGKHPYDLAVGDFNDDGRDDLAIPVFDATGSEVAMRLGGTVNGDPGFVTSGPLDGLAGPLAVGDFNSDSIEDLVVGDGLSPSGHIVLGTGGGTFAGPTTIALSQHADIPGDWAVADFNADGKQDLVAALSTNAAAVRLGAGDGRFPTGSDVAAGAQPVGPAVGDLNSDGNEDFAVADYKAGVVNVRLGDGAGGFRAAPDVAVGAGAAGVVLADFDGDGNLDLATANLLSDSVSVRLGTGRPTLAGNLLVNGGFEGSATAVNSGDSPPVPGWERTGGATFIRYGFPSHAFAPSRLASPRYGGGSSLLWGGKSAATGGNTDVFQTVDVSMSAASIDAGLATANLSAYLGGALSLTDRMSAKATFLNDAAATLGSFEIGPVTAADRHQLTTLLRRAASAPVPSGTRRVRVTVTSIDDDKTYSSALADNVKLTLDAPPPPPGEATGTGTGGTGDAGSGSSTGDSTGAPGVDRDPPVIGHVTVSPAAFAVARARTARLARKGTTIGYTLSEPASVTVRFERAGRRGRPAAAGALRRSGVSGPNRVPFSGRIGRRALRPGRYRLILTAVDAAGNRAASRPHSFRITHTPKTQEVTK